MSSLALEKAAVLWMLISMVKTSNHVKDLQPKLFPILKACLKCFLNLWKVWCSNLEFCAPLVMTQIFAVTF